MKRLICIGCGVGEDLENPAGDIRRVQLMDVTDKWSLQGREEPVEEDLCGSCRGKLRREYFGVSDAELLEMPLMKVKGA